WVETAKEDGIPVPEPRGHRRECFYFFFFWPPPTGAPVATTRLARVGSTPIVTLTVMPGFRSATVALCPFTLISVHCVMINVRAVFSSLTVIVFPVTLAMTGA